VGFVVDRVTLGQVFLLNIAVSPAIYHSINNTVTGTIGTFVAIIPRNSVSLHPKKKSEIRATLFTVVVA
jgi:hypothetical protein